MSRYSMLLRLAVLAVLTLSYACVAKTTATRGDIVAPHITGEQVFMQAQPFLNCSYARFVELVKRDGVYSDARADEACRSCSSFLEIYKETLYERVLDEGFVDKEAQNVVEYAKSVMKAASH